MGTNRSPRGSRPLAAGGLLVVWLLAPAAWGQVFGPGPSETALFDAVIDSPPTPEPSSIGYRGPTEQMNLFPGGLVTLDFGVGPGSEFNLRGGVLDAEFDATNGSEVNVLSGSVRNEFTAENGSVVTVFGGAIHSLEGRSGSAVTIRGGGIRGLDARHSDLEIAGNEFKLDGVPFDGPALDQAAGSTGLLTGTLADGSPLVVSCCLGNARLTRVPIPPRPTDPMTIDSPAGLELPGLREGQSLTVLPGGELRENFAAVDAAITIEGGVIGPGMLLARSDAVIQSGRFAGPVGGGQGGFDVVAGSTLEIRGGDLSDFFAVRGGSTVRLLGGSVGNFVAIGSDSALAVEGGRVGRAASISGEATISGGSFGIGFRVRDGGKATVSGGTFDGIFQALDGSQVDLIGGEFFLDGVLIDVPEQNAMFVIASRGGTLSGTLADGSPFRLNLNAVSDSRSDFVDAGALLRVKVVAIPEPGAACLTLLALTRLWLRR